MSHLLIVELPGGNDTDIIEAALAGGHSFAFLTADAEHYRAKPDIAALLSRGAVIAVPGLAMGDVMERVSAAHAAQPFDAVLCLQDLRIVEAAQIAQALGLRHLNPQAAALCRDKAAVRARLAVAGLPQPESLRVRGAEELLAAVAQLGLPLIIKPVDGFGSQHVFALREAADLAILHSLAGLVADGPGDYGLSVAARGELLVERRLDGMVVGCDTMSAAGRHVLLGVNEKLFFPAPSFAIRGGCFTTNIGQFAQIEAHVFALLDAVGFDHGAAHVELALTSQGPRLIEINPRLVGARIARLISAARGRSLHDAMIALHATGALPEPVQAERHAVTRWIVAEEAGVLEAITLPPCEDTAFVEINLLARPGDTITPPLDNADRLGLVLTCGQDRLAIEALAERIIAATQIRVSQAVASEIADPV